LTQGWVSLALDGGTYMERADEIEDEEGSKGRGLRMRDTVSFRG